MNPLKSIIQSILFVAGRPVSLKELTKITSAKTEEVRGALAELQKDNETSGIVILEQSQSYLMSTSPQNSATVKEFLSIDLREKLTDAAIETLAIITYKQPVTRAEIEAIRGVNSQYTIRLLMMRGLIERSVSTQNSRVNLYRTTHEFLQHLGLKHNKELPDFAELTKNVQAPAAFTKDSGDVTKT